MSKKTDQDKTKSRPSRLEPWILDYEGFKGSEVSSSGGVTGSGKVHNKITNKLYQLKKSVKDAAFARKYIQDRQKDHENFGEVIVNSITRSLTKSDVKGNPQVVPKVFLVTDKERGRVLAASEYLNNVQGTLDEYANKKDGVKQPEKIIKKATKKRKAKIKKEHVKISFLDKSNPEKHKFGLAGDDRALLRQDIADGMAINFLSGNHDVNPGNFLVTKENGLDRARAIDAGKGFNKLLETTESLGGQIRNKDNRILDSLNRETVGHINSKQRVTKLWKDYEGLVPSQELANAFAKMGNAEGLQQGLEQARINFTALVDQFKDNPKVVKHITRSLEQINKNIDGYQITSNDPKIIINQVCDNINAFYKNGQEQMRDVSKLINLQLDVDKSIKEPNNKELQEKINKSYEELRTKKGIKSGEGIEWVKTSKDKPAFKGTVQEYIKERTKDLALQKEGIETVKTKTTEPKTVIRERSNAIVNITGSSSAKTTAVSEPQRKSALTTLAEKFRSSSRSLTDKIRHIRADSVEKNTASIKNSKTKNQNKSPTRGL